MTWSVNKSDKHICTRCGQSKQADEFAWSNMSKGLKNSICNECRRKSPRRKSLEQRKIEFRVARWERDHWDKQKGIVLNNASR